MVELTLKIVVKHVCHQGCDKGEQAGYLLSKVCDHVLERDDGCF